MDKKRISRGELYLNIAHLFSLRSTCGRLQVGAVITLDGRIICTGYNGPPKYALKFDDKCKCDLKEPCQIAIHAEANAISFAARKGIALENSVIYVTHSPCVKCAELIIQAGIKLVYYQQVFRDKLGLEKLYDNGIKVINIDYEPKQV